MYFVHGKCRTVMDSCRLIEKNWLRLNMVRNHSESVEPRTVPHFHQFDVAQTTPSHGDVTVPTSGPNIFWFSSGTRFSSSEPNYFWRKCSEWFQVRFVNQNEGSAISRPFVCCLPAAAVAREATAHCSLRQEETEEVDGRER